MTKKFNTYSLLVAVDSAIDAAPFVYVTSIAPPLILSASWECVGEAARSATPPFISVSDILCSWVVTWDWSFW